MGENTHTGVLMLSVYLGVCDDDGMLSFPSESDDDESVSTNSRDFCEVLVGALALRLSAVVTAAAAAVGLGEDLGSFLMLGLREPLVAALGRWGGISGAGSLSTLSPPLGSSTTGGFSDFLGCFLPMLRRGLAPLSLWAGDFCRPRPPSAPFCAARRSLLGPRPEPLSRPSFLHLVGTLSTGDAGENCLAFLNQLSSCHLLAIGCSGCGGGAGEHETLRMKPSKQKNESRPGPAVTSGEAGRGGSLASLSVVLLSLSLSEPELSEPEPLWLLESSLDCSAPSLLLLSGERVDASMCAKVEAPPPEHTGVVLYLADVFLEAFFAESCSPSLSSLLLSFRSSSRTLRGRRVSLVSLLFIKDSL
ncbi:hypothetical protein EYF80_042534 [Liparis tanakae]|uniref:Uncharacterized protein n=1 Tax=Liparis tanakae TaxID=230148 RepID=A0A4Z2G140_9TELE|nr:hypothetical protein EYF80_042534 [Liparis tanakae]